MRRVDRRPVRLRAAERLRAHLIRLRGAVAEVPDGHLLEPDPLRVRVDEPGEQHRVEQAQLARAARDAGDVDVELADGDREVVGEAVVEGERVPVAAQELADERAGALVAMIDDERGRAVGDGPQPRREAGACGSLPLDSTSTASVAPACCDAFRNSRKSSRRSGCSAGTYSTRSSGPSPIVNVWLYSSRSGRGSSMTCTDVSRFGGMAVWGSGVSECRESADLQGFLLRHLALETHSPRRKCRSQKRLG